MDSTRTCALAPLLLLAACALPQIRASAADLERRVPFLRPRATRFEDVVARIGKPFAYHNAERVFVWQANRPETGPLVFGGGLSDGEPCQLVLEFGDDGALRRGSVVHAE